MRAQEMEANLSQEWWEYWLVYNRERAQAAKEQAKGNDGE